MSKEKSTPQRMCVACREMKDKKLMLRVVKTSEGEVSLDFSGKKSGRGAYVCDRQECFDRLNKYKLLHKVFSANVPDEVYEKIGEEFLAKRNG